MTAIILLCYDYFEARRARYRSSAMISVTGIVQRDDEMTHVIADRDHHLTVVLRGVGVIDRPRLTNPGDGATHAGLP